MLQTKDPRITFKKATKNDLEIILEVEKSQATNKLYSYLSTIEVVEKYLNENTIYFIFVDKKIAGLIMYSLDEKYCAELTGFIVLPEFINQGVGAYALEIILKEISEKNAKQIELKVHPENNKALRMYVKQGFEVRERLENVFGDGEPRLLLKKIIPRN